MMNKPKDAEYYYRSTYYKKGDYYALYFVKGAWRESAFVTNELLELEGVKL